MVNAIAIVMVMGRLPEKILILAGLGNGHILDYQNQIREYHDCSNHLKSAKLL